MIAAGLEARLTCVDPRAVPAALAGRFFDTALLSDLPDGTDPCGERGEFHTCVVAGPMFSAPIHTRPGVVVERDGFVFADLLLEEAGGSHL
jgi:diphthamide synthase (EF-2-diphthine--ammonia ligase)